MSIRHFVIIDGQPVAKGRARSTRSGMHYTPAKTRNWEQMAALVFNRAIGSQCYNVPLKLEITAYFQRPLRLMRKSSSPNRIHHTVKPDADNITKAVADALSKAHVVTDDCIINWQLCVKYYCAKDVQPHVAVMLSGWENEAHEPTDRISKRATALERK
jgi:Holliday junction resolvase RusA-like endonuclease